MTESRDATRGMFLRAILGAVGSLVVLGGVLYAAFWLPFRGPGDALPRAVEILPLERGPAPAITAEIAPVGSAWVDREAGIVRIPVAEAMALVVETLPISEGAVQAAQEREQRVIPTDAGSGRFVPRAQER